MSVRSIFPNGEVYLLPPVADVSGSFTPTLAFVGGTGVTYANQQGAYTIIGGAVCQFSIWLELTSRGTAADGAVCAINGLPVAGRADAEIQLLCVATRGMDTEIATPISAAVGADYNFVRLLDADETDLTYADFEDTSRIFVSGSILI
jgi:hypothetical protein